MPHLDEFSLPALTGDMLFEVVSRKSATAGVWPDGLLDAYIAMIPKVDGDATPAWSKTLDCSTSCLSYLGFC